MRLLIILCFSLAVAGCAGVSSRPGVYTSVGRVVEKVGETIPVMASSDPASRAATEGAIIGATKGRALPLAGQIAAVLPQPTYKFDFQRYWVLLETGEKVSLRTRMDDISVGDCARVWIDAPSISSLYLYTPDMSEIAKSEECKK